jgi:hypothetical protein
VRDALSQKPQSFLLGHFQEQRDSMSRTADVIQGQEEMVWLTL